MAAPASIAQAFAATRSEVDLGKLALAMQRRDLELADSAVDWQALLSRLMQSMPPAVASSALADTRVAFRQAFSDLVASALPVTADELVSGLGMSFAQERTFAGRLLSALGGGQDPGSALSYAGLEAARLASVRADALAEVSLGTLPDKQPFEKIDDIAAAHEASLSHGLSSAYDAARGAIDRQALAAAIDSGDLAAITDQLPLDELSDGIKALDPIVNSAFGGGGAVATEEIGAPAPDPSAWTVTALSGLASDAKRLAADSALKTVTGADALGLDSAALADRVVDRLDLAPKDAAAVSNRYLDEVKGGASPEAATVTADAYADELASARLQTIASDTAYQAANAGQHAAWSLALAQGLVSSGVRRYWITRRDSVVCKVCRPMDGQERKLEERFFSTYSGGLYMNPGDPHPRCRCNAIIVDLGVN
jgi:hypothetical protein